MNILKILGAAALALTFHHAASADIIVSPTGATASSEFGACCDIGNTIDQSGLVSGFTSGVTDFDTYFAQNPTQTIHSDTFLNLEWFSAVGATTQTVTYDLGSSLAINRLALWNEEAVGFGTGVISTSTDGVTFTALTTINPFNNIPDGVIFGSSSYPAEIFGFSTVSARYFRLVLSGCPQPGNDTTLYCAIGEVAFSNVSGVSPVPLPGPFLLFFSALSALGLFGWWRRHRLAVTA